MAKLISLSVFMLLLNVAVGYVLQELNPDPDPVVTREKRHQPEKHFSFHHSTNLGHKEVHKTGELHIGPGGVSHTKHTFVTEHEHEHKPHGQDMHKEYSHYEDEHTGHEKSKPFIDLIGGYVEGTQGGHHGNKHTKTLSVHKDVTVNNEHHYFRDAENFPEDSSPNSDHLDIRGIFGTKPQTSRAP